MSKRRLVFYLLALVGVGALLYLLVRQTGPASDDDATRAGDRTPAGTRAARSGHARMPSLRQEDGRQATVVTGEVRDGDTSRAVADVTILLRSDYERPSATTDGQGRFKLEVYEGGTYEVQLQSESHVAPSPAPTVHVEPGRPIKGLDFTLYQLATVAGRVVDPQGRPVPASPVKVERARGQRRFETAGMTSQSDREGRFTLKVPPGEVVLRAEAGKLGAALSPALYVSAGAHLTGITIRVGGGLTLTGKVTGPGGRKAMRAAVTLEDELGRRKIPCDAEGGFAVGGLSPGIKLVQAEAEGFSPSHVSRVRLSRGRPTYVVLHVTLAKGVGGHVVDRDGLPVAGIQVLVQPGSPGAKAAHLQQPLEQLTTPQGQFSFADVPIAPLLVTARTQTGNLSASRSGVAPGSYDLVLRLQGTGSIIGRVTDGLSGKPVRDFTVSVTHVQGTQGRVSHRIGGGALRVVSATGEFTLDNLVAGTYSLAFTAPGFGATTQAKLSVVEGHKTRANVVLNAGGSVAGVVVDRRGVGLPGASIRVDTGWHGQPAVSDANGNFQVENVARGVRSLTASHTAYDTRIISGISIFPNQTAQVRVELSPRKGKKPGLVFSGIGAVLSDRGGRITVLKTLDGSPAAVAGLLAGDVILTINGLQKGSFADAVEAIRGVVGTPVRLSLRRGKRTFEVDVIRDEVRIPGKS